MSRLFIKTTLTTALSVSLCLGLSAAVFVASAEPAFANNGNGNGNGKNADRGNGNNGRNQERTRNTNRNSDETRGNNGRGAIASELKSLNAAHASPNAMANASPDSMPGKLNTYKENRLALVEAVEEQDEAYAEFQRLSGLTEEEIATEFPEGGYEDALSTATNTYARLREDAVTAQTDSEEALQILTGGRTLSDAAMAELHALLGL